MTKRKGITRLQALQRVRTQRKAFADKRVLQATQHGRAVHPAIDRSQHTKTLGVSYNATDEEIRAAYKKFALKNHPDKGGGKPEVFIEYTDAYNALIGNKDQQDNEAYEIKDKDDRRLMMGGGVRSKMTLFQALRQFNQTFPHHA